MFSCINYMYTYYIYKAYIGVIVSMSFTASIITLALLKSDTNNNNNNNNNILLYIDNLNGIYWHTKK